MKKRRIMFIINVIPLTNIPKPQPQIFSYFYKSNLIKGSIVEIPLSGSSVEFSLCILKKSGLEKG